MLAFLGLGDYERTFEWLDRAIDYRSRDLVLIGVSPIIDPIRSDSRFRDVMQKVTLSR